jgi:phosphoenolpyruvate carboxykinase (ATP)
VLENVVFDPETREVDYNDVSITQNTRASYPIEYIDNAKIPCIGGHPNHIIFLTYDAFGVLPPVSRLTAEQAMYHFISGYTAKVAGTEMGVTEPQATFSAGFGAAFLVMHPSRYAELLAQKMEKHQAKAWLINTGLTGGAYGTGKRMSLKDTRAIINAIHAGEMDGIQTEADPFFGVGIPASVPGVPNTLLTPRNAWADKAAYETTARKLAVLFQKNFEQFAEGSSDAIKNAGPKG